MGKALPYLHEVIKSRTHKYIKRLGAPGQYEYVYETPGEYRRISTGQSVLEDKSELLEDRKFVASKIGVRPENLDYVGIQSFRPLEEKYMYMWNVNDPSSKKHKSTVTGEVRDYPSKQEAKPGEYRRIDLPGVKYKPLKKEKWERFRKELLSNPTKTLKPEIKTSINKELDIYNKNLSDKIPIGNIFKVLADHGVVPIQEDSTKWSGLLVGREGRTNIGLASIGSESEIIGDKQGYKIYEPFKNASLTLSWYTLQSGRYETIAYVS